MHQSPDQEELARGYTPAAAADIGLVHEFWAFLKVRKLFWLAPIIVVLVSLGALFVLAGHAGIISPFIYGGL